MSKKEMPIRIAFATERYNHTKDSLYIFLQECLNRNWETYWFVFEDIKRIKGEIYAQLYQVSKKTLAITKQKTIAYTKSFRAPLNLMDCVFLKRDPPVSKRALNLVTQLNKNVFIVNHPLGIEKYLSNDTLKSFKKFTPNMYFSRNINQLTKKIRQLKNCVLKEDDSHGGHGVHRLFQKQNNWYVSNKKQDNQKINLTSFLKKVSKNQTQKVTVVEYLKNVHHGDKRIIAVNGKIIGAVLRTPKKGSWICNVKAGASVKPTTTTKQEKNMIQTISPQLAKDGVYIVGFDTLTGNNNKRVLSEINTTNVGAFHLVQKYTNKKASKQLMDFIHKKTLEKKYQTKI